MGSKAATLGAVVAKQEARTRRGGLLDRYFYFAMAMIITGVVVYGFSFTVNQNLIHPAIPRPGLLYFHAALFSGWLVFFILQSTLVRAGKVKWHRTIGWFGAGMGVLIPVVGAATAIVMGKFNAEQMHVAGAKWFIMVPLWDMAAFTPLFALAIYWRKKPELHRRLILMATCALTAAGFGRFPGWLLPAPFFYVGVDALILLGVARDWWVNRSVGKVYLYALAVLVVGQTIVTVTAFGQLAYWKPIGEWLLR